MARRLATMVAGLVCGMVLAGITHAQKRDDAAALNAELDRLYQAGKYVEATEIAKRLLAIREKALGPEHPDVGTSLNNLAELYRAQGPLRRGRGACTSAASPSARRRWGPSTPTWGSRSTTWPCCTRRRAATPRPSRSTGAASPSPRRRWGPDHPDVGTSLNNLAGLYQAQGRYAEAEPLLKRSLAIREKALGPEHPDVGTSLNNLARLYQDQGRYAEAEPLLQAQPRHPREGAGARAPRRGHARSTTWRLLYQAQGRYAEAEPLLKRSLAITEKALGPEHPGVGTVAQQPGRAVPGAGPLRRGRAACTGAASPSARRRWGPSTPTWARRSTTWPRCTGTRAATPRPSRLLKRSLAIREKALGPEHPDVGTSLNNLAALYQDAGPLRRGRAACTSAASPSARRRWGPSTPTWAPRSTTWPSCIAPRAATPRPSRCTSAA